MTAKEKDISSFTTTVQVLEGRGLAAKDPNGLSDPYCIIGVSSQSKVDEFQDLKTCVTSEVKFWTLAPVWKKAIFQTENDAVHQFLVEVWDRDQEKADDFMGYVTLDIDKFSEYADVWLPLRSRSKADGIISGEIHVVISRKFYHKNTTENKEQRMVRVFLSSTFLDMHEEREVIMRLAMVELERFCYERGVSLTYIDMRWGITDEMGDNAQTILRCLQEVDNSRPYFVAMMGERYGWHQEFDKKDEPLTKNFENAEAYPEYAWIKNYRTSSVTELEILHGFLLHSHLSRHHVFCYFRDASYIDSLDDSKKPKFKDTSQYAIAKLQKLKEAMTAKAQKGMCTLRHYAKPEEISKLLVDDLKVAIERDFPISGKKISKTQFELANYVHQQSTAYVSRDAYFQAINSAISGDDQRGHFLVITGASGSGKSCLLANWWEREMNKKALRPIFFHFVGLSTFSCDFQSMIWRLFKEINLLISSRGGEPLELPLAGDMTVSISTFLFAASREGGITIVFDAVNKLPEKYHDLHWLPDALPPFVNVIISSLPEVVNTQVLKQRDMVQLAVLPFEDSERDQMVRNQLKLYGKAITEANLKRLVQHELSHIPLFLKTVLSEMCIVGYYEKFQDQLDSFLQAKDFPRLFRDVIARWEISFGIELTKNVLLLILCSRFGVSANVIQHITQAFPIDLFPLISAMKSMLVTQQGNFTFGFEYLRQAALDHYSKEAVLETHIKLAERWKTKRFDKQAALEYPWHLANILKSSANSNNSMAQEELSSVLLDLNKFSIFVSTTTLTSELIKYWELLTTYDAKWNIGKMYENQVSLYFSDANPGKHTNTIVSLVSFLSSTGYPQAALSIARQAVSKLQESDEGEKNSIDMAKLLEKVGDSYLHLQKFNESERYFMRSLTIYKKLLSETDPILAGALSNLGNVFHKQRKLGPAMDYHNKALAIRMAAFGDTHPSISASLTNLGLVLRQQGKLDLAIDHINRSVSMDIKLFGTTHPGIATSYYNLAIILVEQKKLDEAADYYNRALCILTRLFGETHPVYKSSLFNLACVYEQQGKLEESENLFQKSLSVDTKMHGDFHYDVAKSLFWLGMVNLQQKKFTEAAGFFRRAIDVYTHEFGGEHYYVARALTALGDTFREQGDLDAAMENLQKALEIYEKADHPESAATHLSLAKIYKQQGHKEEAEKHFAIANQ
eukprot:Phypoly_transcript_00891.p1 GENE.Phypoly_transcript_00891~~Phypoly_transcript_00891.p1  ORF type:complete len:1193 (+),score=210.89 Phypoly_transcript_00891:164-3742(+)